MKQWDHFPFIARTYCSNALTHYLSELKTKDLKCRKLLHISHPSHPHTPSPYGTYAYLCIYNLIPPSEPFCEFTLDSLPLCMFVKLHMFLCFKSLCLKSFHCIHGNFRLTAIHFICLDLIATIIGVVAPGSPWDTELVGTLDLAGLVSLCLAVDQRDLIQGNQLVELVEGALEMDLRLSMTKSFGKRLALEQLP